MFDSFKFKPEAEKENELSSKKSDCPNDKSFYTESSRSDVYFDMLELNQISNQNSTMNILAQVRI